MSDCTGGQVREIQLTRGMVAIVDEEDYERLAAYKWRASKNRCTWYACTNNWLKTKPVSVSMHRIILGVTDSKTQVDHRNGNGLDNRKTNLRLANKYENGFNARISRRNTSGYKGVTWNVEMNKWHAKILAYGKWYHLGYHKDPKEAATAYDEAAKRLQGEFAWLNFPEK